MNHIPCYLSFSTVWKPGSMRSNNVLMTLYDSTFLEYRMMLLCDYSLITVAICALVLRDFISNQIISDFWTGFNVV